MSEDETRHLAAVPDPDPPPDHLDPTYVEITDTSVAFTAAVGSISLDKKTSGLIIPLIVDPNSPLSHRDIATLRFRHLAVEISPQARGRDGQLQSSDPKIDPVRAAVQARNAERMVKNWVDGELDSPPRP